MAYRNRNFDRNNYGGSISRNVDPWDNSGDWGMRGNNMGGPGNHNGGGGGGGGNFNQNQSNELANHLLQLLRNQGGGGNQGPPSLMDLPQGDMRGYGPYGGGRNNGGGGGGDFDRFDDRRMGGGGHNNHSNGRPNNNHNNNRNAPNRRMGGGGGGGGGAGQNMRPHSHQQSHHMKGGGGGGGNNHNQQRNSGGIRKPNSVDRTKKVLAKNAQNHQNNPKHNNKAGGGDAAKAKNAATAAADQSFADENEENENGTSTGESAYADVPADMFFCHLCKKHMWDSTSFENHIKGRTHQMMKEGVEESYRLKANMIRQEAKIDEQLKSIEVDRLKRMGKQMKNANAHREYCQMCDLHFYGHLSTHRKSDGHLMLKKFLHPRCPECNEEFQNRIEYDAHLLSREHMLRCAAKANRVDQRRKNQLMILTEADESKDVREEKQKAAAAAAATTTATTTADATAAAAAADGAEVKTEAEGETPAENGDGTAAAAAAAATGEEKPTEEVKVEEQPENPDVILDFIEGTTEVGVDVEARIPAYKSTRALATSMIAKLECFECKLCNRFFDNEKTAEVHSRTVYHHKQFSKFLTEKANEAKIAQKRAAATVENEKRKRARLEKEEKDAAAAVKAENGEAVVEDGAAAAAPAANGTAEGAAVDAKEDGEPAEKKLKVEMYDPCEATGDTEEAEKESPAAEVTETAAPVAAAAAAAPVAAEATPATPAKAAPATPVAETKAATPAATPSPANNKGTPGRGRGGNRGTPRGRGRGRRF